MPDFYSSHKKTTANSSEFILDYSLEMAECRKWDINSPIGKWLCINKGMLSDRIYRLLEGDVKNEKVYFLNLYANGTFEAPSMEFRRNVEPYIIQELHSMGYPKPNVSLK